MIEEVTTIYHEEKNSQDALINVPHDNYGFDILIEKYSNREDFDSLIIEVFQEADETKQIMRFKYKECINSTARISGYFSIPVNKGFKPPFLIRISPDVLDVEMEDFSFIVTPKDLLVK